MKKLLLAAILVIPALWAGLTWFTSGKVEKMYDHAFAENNRALESFSDGALKMEKHVFQKGFLKSTAKTIVSIDHNKFSGEELPEKIILNHVIYHGPVMRTPNGIKTGSSYIYTTLDRDALPADKKTLLDALFGENEPFTIGTLTGLGDEIDIDIELASFALDENKLRERTGNVISFSGAKGHITTNRDVSILKGAIKTGPFKMTDHSGEKQVTLAADPGTISMDIDDMYKGTTLDGSFSIEFPKLSYEDDQGTKLVMTNLKLSQKSDETDGKITSSAFYGVEKLQLIDPARGIDLPEYNVQATFEGKGFSRDAVVRLIDLTQELEEKHVALNDHTSGQSEKETDILLERLLLAFSDMITQGAGIGANLKLASSKTGQATANLDIHYNDTKKIPEHKTVGELVAALRGNLNVRIDKKLITGTSGAEESLALPAAMGLIVDKGEHLEMTAELSGKELNLNGEAVPIEAMLGPIAGQPIPWDMLAP